jgi:hypothetical protein
MSTYRELEQIGTTRTVRISNRFVSMIGPLVRWAFNWWNFIQSAAQSATELGDDERQQVLARLASAPEPGGFVEARCLQMFSRWRWRAGDADGALDFSRRAVLADPTWPGGHIDLAWYGLMTGKFDPLPRLREALRVAPSLLAEIRAIPEFARLPELVSALEVGQEGKLAPGAFVSTISRGRVL